jgi:hypothetical protein
MSEQLFECPNPDCDKEFDEEYKLDQHMEAMGHESDEHGCDCDGECCAPTIVDDWDDELEPMQVEHTIKVTHVQRKEIHLRPPRKSSEKIVTTAGRCLEDPETCSMGEVKGMAASLLSVSRGHDDPVYRSGKTIVEEYIDEDYDEDYDYDSDDDAHCDGDDCSNMAAQDCENACCRRCCDGCERHR